MHSFHVLTEKTEHRTNIIFVSYFSTGLIRPFRTILKLKDHKSLPNSDPKSGLRPLASPAQRSKLVKVEIVNTEEIASYGGDDEELPGFTAKAPAGKEKGKRKAARRLPAQTPSSQSAVSPKRPSRLYRNLTPHLRAS